MIDVIGFWTSVTLIVGLPFWFFGYRITRLILSIAKKAAPGIPWDLRRAHTYGHWDYHLYPQWAHNLNAAFGGGRLSSEGVLVLGVCAFIPCILLAIGIFGPQETVVEVVGTVSTHIATPMGWLFVVVTSTITGVIGITKGSRLVGLIQIQEMREKKRENR